MTFSRWFLFVFASFSTGERGKAASINCIQHKSLLPCAYFLFFKGYFFIDKLRNYKFFALFWFLPVLVIFTIYRAHFHALVVRPMEYYLISGISQLPQRPDVKVHVFKDAVADEFFSVIILSSDCL